MRISRRLARRLVVIVPLAVACVMPGDLHAQSVHSPELVFVAPPELQPAATALRRLDPQKLVAVMRALGITHPGPPMTVMLAPEDSPLARQSAPWVAGYAIGQSGSIVMFPARAPVYPYDSMEALLQHEVTHVLITRAAPNAAIPRWFHEGLALALERSWRLRDRSEVALAVVGGRHSLAEIEADFHGSATAVARAYGVAGAFVRDLIGRHGPDFPSRVLGALARGAPFDAAFSAATSESLAAAERRFWRESWWYRVVPLLTSSIVLWMGIVLLAVSARRRRAAQRRALRARWNDEERELSVAEPTGQ